MSEVEGEVNREPVDDAPTGFYQIPMEQFRIQDVELYDRAFLIKVVRHLFELLSKSQQRAYSR
jgi:hypothetical protein